MHKPSGFLFLITESMNKNEKPGKYFQDALSDFVYDAASGRAIRHLTDSGYTAAQIMQQLSYPTPFKKIQLTITRHLKETGVLLEELPLPDASFYPVRLRCASLENVFSLLVQYLSLNGEEYSYVSCPSRMSAQTRSVLTARERDYLDGILWESSKVMYHRLNRRMLEIGAQMAFYSGDVCFYFLKSGEAVLFMRE